MAKKKQLSYEEASEELEVILSDLEKEMTSIDDLSVKVKRARELIVYCKEKLRSAEDSLKELEEDL